MFCGIGAEQFNQRISRKKVVVKSGGDKSDVVFSLNFCVKDILTFVIFLIISDKVWRSSDKDRHIFLIV